MADINNPEVSWDDFLGLENTAMTNPILFFDGYCHLCQASVKYILRHEKDNLMLFAPLDSKTAKAILPKTFKGESIVLYVKGKIYTHSTAAIMLALYLKKPYAYLYYLKIIPRPLRDMVYKLIAHYRYRWFGKSDTCMIPDVIVKNRFIY